MFPPPSPKCLIYTAPLTVYARWEDPHYWCTETGQDKYVTAE